MKRSLPDCLPLRRTSTISSLLLLVAPLWAAQAQELRILDFTIDATGHPRAQVYECLAYYEDHQSELDPLVAAQNERLNE